MADSTKCPRCGGDLPANFPSGVCPACLLQQGLSPSTFMSGASGNSGSRPRYRWTPPTPAELGPRFPQLEIVELLGQGGMGAVYKVRQRDLDRWAALKILPDEVAQDPNFAERFQREARALALLGHQHIVIVYEFGQRDGVYFLLMEFVDGVNLRHAIRAGHISAADALGIVTQICDALQFAHEEGVVHRDIKPENILIDKRGRVKIADFGLAKLLGRSVEVATLTGTHQVMGTPVYMAPEQMEGTRGVDHRADIFSLGVVFYELLTGELPLGRFAPPSQKYSLDVRLDEVVLRTLEKEPDRRYQQASQVKGDVESIRSQPSVLPPTTEGRSRRSRIRWKVVLASAFGLLATLIIIRGAIVTMVDYDRLSKALAESRQQAMRQQYANSMQLAQRSLRDAPEPANGPAATNAERDPNEAFAIVQFTPDSAKLHPSFGQSILTPEHRVLVNQILTRIHKQYLELESRYTDFVVKEDGTQMATIMPARREAGPENLPGALKQFADDISRLENEFWTEIDAQVPYEQQNFLRQNLPLFADAPQQLLVGDAFMGGASGMMGGGMGAMGPIPFDATGAAMMPPMGAGGYRGNRPRTNLRYEQLLGWKQEWLPIRITIGRRGKWFRWTIETHNAGSPESLQYLFGNVQDQGEDPELPSGLRRFWRNNVSTTPKPVLSPTLLDDFSEGPKGFSPTRSPESRKNSIVEDPSATGDPPFDDLSDAPIDSNSTRPPRSHRHIGSEEPKINRDPFAPPLEFENQRVERNLVSTQINDESHSDPIDNQPPSGFVRPLENPFETPIDVSDQAPKQLDEFLREIDNLRNGDRTPWAEVEDRSTRLLKIFPSNGDKGRIHWQAAHVYGQSGIRDHAADVTRHAKEALKYERDPIQRAWMFMYLGNAAEVHHDDPRNFVENRAEATRWYLKGYVELLPFHLPPEAPELPAVEKISEGFRSQPDGDVDPEQISAEVRHAAQMKVRQAAEVTRELVQKRDIYVARLKELFGRLHEVYDKDADAEIRFRAIATKVMPDPKQMEMLVGIVFTSHLK